jgi:hypothetical protein
VQKGNHEITSKKRCTRIEIFDLKRLIWGEKVAKHFHKSQDSLAPPASQLQLFVSIYLFICLFTTPTRYMAVCCMF